jgi:hypothetical protein
MRRALPGNGDHPKTAGEEFLVLLKRATTDRYYTRRSAFTKTSSTRATRGSAISAATGNIAMHSAYAILPIQLDVGENRAYWLVHN